MNADIASTPTLPAQARRAPAWLRATAGLGLLWNGYGTFQFLGAVAATRESLLAMGMTEAQAAAMSSYPVWMTLAFAVGTFGGLAGSGLLLARRKAALPALIASLAGYALLYIGDITEGIFAALGIGQVAILSIVVAIAAGLLWVARRAAKDGLLG